MADTNEESFSPSERFSLRDGDQTSSDFHASSSYSKSEESVAALSPGDLIANKYEIVKLISAGGMGAIYKALNRDRQWVVAIKVLLVDKPVTDVAYRRFEREAQAVGTLSHPNIVSVYDYGLISAHKPYIVMELLDGASLAELLSEKGRLIPEEFVSIFAQVCDALAHAHTHGLIHRDLKPSNIMLLTDYNGKTRVKIIDFGIAKIATNKTETSPITKPGQIFGSPLYMSPEQCMGQKLDARSDIYSLGCVMYEAICGSPPLVGDTLLSTIYKQVNELPPPFSVHLQTSTRLKQPEAAVMKMLQKQPDDRFQSVEEVMKVLDQIASGKGNEKQHTRANSWVSNRIFSNRSLRLIVGIAILIFFALALKAFIDRQNSAERSILPPHRSRLSNE